MRLADASGEALVRALAGLNWADIDQICEAALSGGVFSGSFFKKCITLQAKVVLRRMLKSGKLLDADGVVIKMASIVIKDKETGQDRRVYKREDLFDEEDFVQVMLYHKRQAKTHIAKMKYYRRAAIKKFGPRVQAMLPGFEDLMDKPLTVDAGGIR